MCRYDQCKKCGNYSVLKYSPNRDVNTPLFDIGPFFIDPGIESEVDFCNRTNSPIDFDDYECNLYETDEQTMIRLQEELNINSKDTVAKEIFNGLLGSLLGV